MYLKSSYFIYNSKNVYKKILNKKRPCQRSYINRMMGSKFLKVIEGCFCYYIKNFKKKIQLYFLLIKKGKTRKKHPFY